LQLLVSQRKLIRETILLFNKANTVDAKSAAGAMGNQAAAATGAAEAAAG